MKVEIVSSGDGSHTLFLPEMNETYHSLHGALTESQHVFIKMGLEVVGSDSNEVTILEIGFGTGLNAFLSLIWAEEHKKNIHFQTMEPFPLSPEILEKLNYSDHLPEKWKAYFQDLHAASWENPVRISEYFTIHKSADKLEDYSFDQLADLIYFDAFAPNKQPEVWDLSNIEKCYSMLKSSGILVSYCAQGQFKRNLKAAGFEVESLPGPPGKKEMTRGVKKL